MLWTAELKELKSKPNIPKMYNRTISPFSPELREAVAEVVRSTEPLLDDLVAHTLTSADGRVILVLNKVKQSHGRARREALRELDRVVTDLFPPVEGAPLPSEELNGKPDVLGGALVTFDYNGETNTSGVRLYPSGHVPLLL